MGQESPFQFFWSEKLTAPSNPSWAASGAPAVVLRQDRSRVRPGEGPEGARCSEVLTGLGRALSGLHVHRSQWRPTRKAGWSPSQRLLHLNATSQNVL